jgi:hypothetical protein
MALPTYSPPYKPPTPPPIPPEPTVSDFATAVYNQLGFPVIVGKDDPNNIILNFLGAIGWAFEQMDDLAHSGEGYEPWARLMDLNIIPDEGIPWLGQFSGVDVDPNLDAGGQRQQVMSHVGWNRGTPAVLAAALMPYLTGTQTVAFIERDTSPYHFSVSTYASETPDANLVVLAIEKNKPAGLQYTYTDIAGSPSTTSTYQVVFNKYNIYDALYAANATYQDVYNVTALS